MDMKHRLICICVRVYHCSLTAFRQALGLRDFSSQQMHLTDERRVSRFVQRRDVFSRNNEDMGGRLRIDVAEGNAARVLHDELSWNRLRDDFAKEAIA